MEMQKVKLWDKPKVVMLERLLGSRKGKQKGKA